MTTDPAPIIARLAAVDARRTALLLERRELMAQMRASGESLEDIGEAFGLSRARVQRILARDLAAAVADA